MIASLNAGFRSRVRDLIEEGVERGEIRKDLDPDAEAAVVLALLRGVGLQWMADPGCFDLEAVGRSVDDAIRRQLAIRDGEDLR